MKFLYCKLCGTATNILTEGLCNSCAKNEPARELVETIVEKDKVIAHLMNKVTILEHEIARLEDNQVRQPV